jgi:hypothetical protein
LIVFNHLAMLPAIKLNPQFLLITIKVENVSPNRMLPPEFRTSDTAIAHPSYGFANPVHKLEYLREAWRGNAAFTPPCLRLIPLARKRERG